MSSSEDWLTKRLQYMSFIYDLDQQKFIYIDDALREGLKLEEGALSLDDARKFIYQEDEDYITDSVSKMLNGQAKPFINARLNVKGQERCFQFSVIRLQDEDSRLILGNADDISREMENLRSMQRFANKKNSILQILGHDLRGPLGVVQMTTQILQQQNTDEQLTKYLTIIKRIIEQSIGLITDLTKREFLETMDVALVKHRVNIAGKLQEYVNELERSASAASRHFSFESSQDPLYISVDEAKFMQIINNLTVNSLKFTHDGGTISYQIEEREDSIIFSVRDDGIGIPDDMKSEIFKEYSNAGRTGLRGEQSTGTGLFVVKTIVDWHDGEVWFDSEEGRGSTFYFKLPK